MEYWKKPNNYIKPKAKNEKITFKFVEDVLDKKEDLESFDMSRTAFALNFMDLVGIKNLEDDHLLKKSGLQSMGYDPDRQSPGLSRLDDALNAGAGAIEGFTNGQRILSGDSGACLILENGDLHSKTIYSRNSEVQPDLEGLGQYRFEDNSDASHSIKKAALLYGADLVGVAPFDERWLYNSELFIPMDHGTGDILEDYVDIKRKVDFGFIPKSVIVLAYEMDKDAYLTQPSYIGGAATTIGYSRMIENSTKIASFIEHLGYHAQHAGNDIGLSVPTAIQAGLGEGSRMGLLVTPEFGARVRLARVYTDLELEYDKPITFGVKETCEVCKMCAKKCPAGAISKISMFSDSENIPWNTSNRKSKHKWYTNGHKCLSFWGKNTSECGVCITSCKYSY